jgi:hypothetical protein
VLWKVQLWLDNRLIEEHIAPPELAEQYANLIRLRIRNLPGRGLRCEPVREPESASAPELNSSTGAARLDQPPLAHRPRDVAQHRR